MLGWHISVYRQGGDRAAPAQAIDEHGARIAVWQTGLGGLGWIEEAVRSNGHFLGGDGYPYRYTAQAHDLLPTILAGPPHANKTWHHDPGDVLGSKWIGRTLIDTQTAEACAPGEWLLIEAWDQS